MRFGVVTTSFPRQPDDYAGSFVAAHCDWLRRQGHQVEVVAAAPAGDIAVGAGSSLFYRGGAPEAFAGAAAGVRALPRAAMFQLAQAHSVYRSRHQWDALIAHWLVPSGLSAALASHLPLTVVCHSGDVHLARRWRLLDPIARLLAGRDAKLLFVSDELRQGFFSAVRSPRVRDHLRARSVVSPMGIDFQRFGPATRDPAARPHVVFLGRLSPIKGIDVLLDASAMFLDRATVSIAGPGTLGRTPRGVRVLGEVRGRKRDALLASADIVVVPSLNLRDGRTEGTPLVALEAMASGAAVVASQVGGLRSLGDAMMLVPPGDAHALAEAIGALIDDPHRRAQLAERGRRLSERFDWSAVGPALVPGLPRRAM